jgi:hypothetical protein
MPIRYPKVVMVARPTMGRCHLPPNPALRVNRPVAAVAGAAVVDGGRNLKARSFEPGFFLRKKCCLWYPGVSFGVSSY